MSSSIHIENLSVRFPLFSATSRSIKSSMFSLFDPQKVAPRYHDALSDVSMTIEPGDRVCLVGLNGAGKTTLLKTMAGIIPPSGGRVHIKGTVSPLLDYATGFEMEMTGYDNIVARGLFLGFSSAEMRAKQDEIAEFSELGKFLHEPVKTYSSGMFVRLAFAIVTSITPDILIVDEIMGAGDQAFADKAQRRMMGIIEKGNIVVMATHSTALAKQLCNKVAWFQSGRLVEFGPAVSVIDSYIASVSH